MRILIIMFIMFIMTGCAPGHKLGDYLILTINQPCETIDGYIEKQNKIITNHNKKLVKEINFYKES